MLRKLMAMEAAQYRALGRWVTRRPYVPAGATPLPYVGAVAVLLWAFVIVSVVETVVLHLILPWDTVRLVLDVLSVWGVLFVLGLAATQHVRPHLLTDEGLVVRSGTSFELLIPWDQVASVAPKERSVDKKRSVQVHDGVLSVVVTSRTNVDVRLSSPLLHEGQQISEVRFLCDEPKRAQPAAAR